MIQPDFKRISAPGQAGQSRSGLRRFHRRPADAGQRLSAHRAGRALLVPARKRRRRRKNRALHFRGRKSREVFRYATGACVLEGRERVVWEENEPVAFLRARMERFRPVRVPGLPPLVAGAIGYFAYDMVRLVERIRTRLRDDIGLFDAVLIFYHGIIAFDHVQHRLWIVRNVFTDGEGSLRKNTTRPSAQFAKRAGNSNNPSRRKAARRSLASKRSPLNVKSNFRRAEYLAAVKKCKEYIRAGDIFQVVVSQRFSAKTKAASVRHLSRASRASILRPISFICRLHDVSVVGSSPEMLVKVQGRDVFYRPIAGTLPRGKDEAEDQRLEEQMLAERKRTRRAHHARRPRPQRSRPRLRIRQCESRAAHDRRALLPRHAFGLNACAAASAKTSTASTR